MARGQRSKSWTVLVSADVAHQVVGPVGCQAGFQRCLERGSASAQVAKEGYGRIVEVKVELRVKESAAHIAVDELRRPVGFANLKQASALGIGHALLEFARQRAPVELVHVLRRVVAKSIKAIVLNPGHGRVGHGHHGGRKRGIKGRKVLVKPGGQPVVVPALGVERRVGQVKRGGPVGLRLEHRVFQVHVVADKVNERVESALVGRIVKKADFFLSSHAGVRMRGACGPVAVVAREAREDAPFGPKAPGSLRIAVQGREPNGIESKGLKKAFLQLLLHALDIAAVVVVGRQYVVAV